MPCVEEYLRIHNGPAESSDILVEYCLNSSRDELRVYQFFSSRRSLLIETKKGTNNSTSGFYVSYKAIDFEECSLNSTLDAPLSPVEHNFSSPYYPNGYPTNTTCGWYITAPENHTVVLHLTYRLNNNAKNDKVEVYDVDGSERSLINFFRRSYSTRTVTIYSKFNSLYVLFQSYDQMLWRAMGLFVSYTAITPALSCSSGNSLDENKNIVLKDPSGVIKTPGYPSSHPVTQCYWKIFTPKGKVVRVDFSSFRLAGGACIYLVQTINKKNSIETVHCGQKPSFVIYSVSNELGIRIQELYRTGPGFIANYTTVTAESSGICKPGENSTVHLTGQGISFASPNFPVYPGNGSCHWNISVPPGNFIRLTFWHVYGSCNSSYVEVYDVTNSAWINTRRFCSLFKPQVVYSKGSSFLVTYVIASESLLNGFFATYETLTVVPAPYACSKSSLRPYDRITLHDTSGELASYQYPLPYSNDVNCFWTIEVPVGYNINFTFHSFDLQQSEDCLADYVLIKQEKYSWQTGDILTHSRRFCGSSLPAAIQSNHTKMNVDFVADSSGRYPGFHASYTAIEDPTMGPCKKQGIDNVIRLSGETGRLFSPLYPETFPRNMKCTWIITVLEGNFVKLRTTSLLFAYICKEGTNLEIRDGQSSSSDLIKTFCGQNFESSVFSSGRHLWVRFQSSNDSFQYGTGFNALFEMVDQLPAPFSCTARNLRVNLKSEKGTLASYNYPLSYDDAVECVWSINVDTDSVIELSFDFFNLSDSADCSEDYVEVRDGLFSESQLIGKFCGSNKPSKITSDMWHLRVVFKSSGKMKYPGFKATYETKKTDSTVQILKAVGISLGALFLLCLVISICIVCYKRTHNQPQPGAVLQGADNAAHVTEDTRKQTTSF